VSIEKEESKTKQTPNNSGKVKKSPEHHLER